MVKLPFVVEPRLKPRLEKVGSDESGYLECERRGYLTSGEKAFVQQAFSNDDSTILLIGLARKVAHHYEVDVSSAYQAVIAVLSGGEPEGFESLQALFFEDINNCIRELTNLQAREDMVMALCMLRYRVNTEASVEDVMGLHPDVVKGLVELYRDEEARSVERLKGEVKEDEIQDGMTEDKIKEAEKKPKVANVT